MPRAQRFDKRPFDEAESKLAVPLYVLHLESSNIVLEFDPTALWDVEFIDLPLLARALSFRCVLTGTQTSAPVRRDHRAYARVLLHLRLNPSPRQLARLKP